MTIVTKRTVMTLYSDATDIHSHVVRFVLREKGVNVEIHHVDPLDKPERLLEINPYATVPTLIDRELVLYHAPIIMEYLDERFPHPPLLPVYPVARAECRKMMYRIENDWYSLFHIIENNSNEEKVRTARKHLQESLVSVAPVFADKPYFLHEEFTLLDCCLGPLFWRLSQLGIHLPEEAAAIKDYAGRVFTRASFQASLSDLERELNVA